MEHDLRQNWGEGAYKYHFRDYLKIAINKWKNDRKKSWAKKSTPKNIKNILNHLDDCFVGGERFKKREIFEFIEKFAEAVIATSKTCAPLELGIGLINYFYEETDLCRYAEERLEADLAEDMIQKCGEAARRIASLDYELEIVGKIHSIPAVTNFLKLVMRCYTWGFDTECIILCRSAMENAIENRVTYDMCEKYLGQPKGGYYTLDDRIVVAKLERILNDEIAEIATSIRVRGNTALHKDPNLTMDIHGTIRETVRVISVVASGRDPYATPSWLIDIIKEAKESI